MTEHLAEHAGRGDLDAVERMLAAGADVHTGDDRPLQWAARHGHLAVVERLLVAGANVHANTDSALRWASSNGYLPVVECLITAGADVHANTELALRWAAGNRNVAVVERLLEAGADLDAALGRLDGQDVGTAHWLRATHKSAQARRVAASLDDVLNHGNEPSDPGGIGL